VAFGLYSCNVLGCGNGSAKAASHGGASGTVVLAKLTLLPTKAGTLSIALGSMRFVDAAGKLLSVSLPGAISVKVATGGTNLRRSRRAKPDPRHGQRRHQTADISGDGFVGRPT
jgi:hypothetical protein